MPESGPSAQAKIAAFLRYLTREGVKREGTRPLARRVGVSHPTIIGVVDGTNALTKARTQHKLAEAFDINPGELYARAAEWATTNRALVEQESSESRVEYDPGAARQPSFGLLSTWAEAEAAARTTWKGRAIPEEAWARARNSAGALTPKQVTPSFVLGLAELFAEALAREPNGDTGDKA